MDEVVNLICPHSPEINNITEIKSLDELNLLPAEPDTETKVILEEIFNEFYDAIEQSEELTDDSPEVVFAKYLWIIRLKVQELEKIKATADKLIHDIETWTEHKSQQHQGQIDF